MVYIYMVFQHFFVLYFVFTLAYHMEKFLLPSVAFWKLGIRYKFRIILSNSLQTEMWNQYWNKVCSSLCFTFYSWSSGENAGNIWKETNDSGEVYRWNIFVWEHDEESLKVFIDQVNIFYPTIKFTAEYSKVVANFFKT